jgi:signal transduction histidine kinase
LALSVRDNGHGFDVAQTDRQGVGLRSMRERIESLGGTLHISSSVGGTRIEIGIPLSQRLPIASPTGATASAGAVASHEQATRIERKN